VESLSKVAEPFHKDLNVLFLGPGQKLPPLLFGYVRL